MYLRSYLIPQTIAHYNSPFNGPIKVVVSFGKLYIDAGGLMQSGNFLLQTWVKGLKKLKIFQKNPQKILLLGLGGGSFIQLSKKYFPRASVLAVDIDPVIVDIGKKYLDLCESKHVTIRIEDAQKTVARLCKQKQTFDLIFVDLYQGYQVPVFVEDAKFLRSLAELKTKNGDLIFNRLYFQKYKNEAKKFLDKLKTLFHDVEEVHVYANLLIKVS
ncbi:hypothetical protein C4564_05570 [Candidatus Microgenomates bacterium]|nr:MAG: hypothetical protein C4564_05570 [Candidatus Microgenomates bacterium]